MMPQVQPIDKVRAAKRFFMQHHDEKGVTSVGIGTSEDSKTPAVVVTVLDQATLARMPRKIDGVPVLAIVSGAVSPL